MPTANISVRVDASLKKDAEKLFHDLGLNMSSTITMLLKSAIQYGGTPFDLKRVSPNPETEIALAEYEEM